MYPLSFHVQRAPGRWIPFASWGRDHLIFFAAGFNVAYCQPVPCFPLTSSFRLYPTHSYAIWTLMPAHHSAPPEHRPPSTDTANCHKSRTKISRLSTYQATGSRRRQTHDASYSLGSAELHTSPLTPSSSVDSQYPTPPSSMRKGRRETFVIKNPGEEVDKLKAVDDGRSSVSSSGKASRRETIAARVTPDTVSLAGGSSAVASSSASSQSFGLSSKHASDSDVLAELQALSLELEKMSALGSPQTPQHPVGMHRSRRQIFDVPERTPEDALAYDALDELLAVAAELNNMQRLDSHNLLNRQEPGSTRNRSTVDRRRREAIIAEGIPAAFVSFLEVSSFLDLDSEHISRRILEFEVYEHSFNGVEVPSILVTQAEDPLLHSRRGGLHAMPSTGLLAPPLIDARGRVEAPLVVAPNPIPIPAPTPSLIQSALQSEDSFVSVNLLDAISIDPECPPILHDFVRCDCVECTLPNSSENAPVPDLSASKSHTSDETTATDVSKTSDLTPARVRPVTRKPAQPRLASRAKTLIHSTPLGVHRPSSLSLSLFAAVDTFQAQSPKSLQEVSGKEESPVVSGQVRPEVKIATRRKGVDWLAETPDVEPRRAGGYVVPVTRGRFGSRIRWLDRKGECQSTDTSSTKCSTLVRAPLSASQPRPGSEAFEKQLRKRLRRVAPADDSFKSRLAYKANSWIDRVRGLPKRVIRLPTAPPPSRAASLVLPLIFVTCEDEMGVEYKPVARRQRVKTTKAKKGSLVEPRVRYSWQWNPKADVPTERPVGLAPPPDVAPLQEEGLLAAIPEEPESDDGHVVDVCQRMADMDVLVARLRAEMDAEGSEDSADTVRMPSLVREDGDSPALDRSQDTTIGEDEYQTAQEDCDSDVVAEHAALIKYMSKLWEDLDEDEMCLELQRVLAAIAGEDA
ncbi:hypothetical protein EVG20_g1489 [Dentipellis fragilis]|uniref:Uncharacterized protein n=1 Tax=Dentipellis fragilis TaxID=205917 RepID=A0A4Y9Z9R0_9AGAM|nr:hypothetical protein EVG20_g1489 [Dentipellis fragilis]